MFEKLGIRIATSLIVLWYIVQMSFVKVYIDFHTFAIMLFYAILLSLMIESMYSLLRCQIQYSLYIVVILLCLCAGIYFYLGWGMYFGMSIYVGVSISIDLLREYHMTKLLKKAIHHP